MIATIAIIAHRRPSGDAKAPPERKPAGFGADAKALTSTVIV